MIVQLIYWAVSAVRLLFAQVLNRGWTNRRVASTSMNRESSRSHAVFMLSVESKKRVRRREREKEADTVEAE